MSRSASFIGFVAFTLVGCSMFKPSLPDLPKQPDAPTKPDNMTVVGAQQDKADARVAAAVTVAQRNADKPSVVKAETGVALSYLPAPTEADLAYAEKRAAKADPAEYEAAQAYGKKLLARLNANWDKMEADQKEAKRVSDLKDARIAELTKEIDRVKKEASRNIWTLAGVGIAVVGALATAFASPRIGIPLLACGAAIGAFPFVVESPYFAYIAGTFLAALAALGIWYAWDKVRDKVRESDKAAEAKPSDAQPPQA